MMDSYFERKENQRDRDERPSWRDRDAKKDGKSPYRDADTNRQQAFRPHNEQRAETEAKKALESLFTPKKTKKQSAEWKKLTEAKGPAFAKQAEAYVEAFGMPRDWDDLLRLADHPDPEFLLKVLEQLELLANQKTPTQLDLCVGKLRVLKVMAEDPRISETLHRMITGFSAEL